MDFGAIEMLNADERPTFVLDRDSTGVIIDGLLQPVFCNSALQSRSSLVTSLFSRFSEAAGRTSYGQFRNWSVDDDGTRASHGLVFPYGGMRWQRFTIGKRWTVVGAVSVFLDHDILPPTTPMKKQMVLEAPYSLDITPQEATPVAISVFSNRPPAPQNTVMTQSNHLLDWTRHPSPPNLSQHICTHREHDWRSTSVGPMENWSSSLRLIVNMLMSDPNPALLFWGTNVNNLTMFFNEQYVTAVASHNHNKLRGSNPKETFSEIWGWLSGILNHGFTTGETVREEDVLICVDRLGKTEENYVNYAFIPLLGDAGKVVGFYEAIQDTTQRTIARRRTAMFLAVSRLPAVSVGLKDFGRHTLTVLEPYEHDIPFALLYSLGENDEDDDCDIQSPSVTARTSHLRGSIGIRAASVESTVLLGKGNHTGLARSLWMSMESGKHMILTSADGSLPAEITEAQDLSRSFGDKCTNAVLFPLRRINGNAFHGFLLIGVNTRRSFDTEYEIFIERLGTELALSLDPVIAHEEQMRKGVDAAEQAALEKAMLSEELLQRTRETKQIEHRFFRVTQLAPVGIFLLAQDGSVIWSNDKWYDLCQMSKEDRSEMGWLKSIWPEDVAHITSQWNKLTRDAEPVHFEVRLNKPWNPPMHAIHSSRGFPFTWGLVSAYPEMSSGSCIGVTGVITDVSELKWGEVLSQQRADDAIESKRQQENFVDMTSHEIRNPLNAIVQCADTVIQSMAGLPLDENIRERVEDSISAAETIAFCAQHQKRIVDDILTLSKLDSNLLNITFVDVQPILMVGHAIKIFEAQAQKSNIMLQFVPEPSLAELDINWLQLDPSRVLQILINLITNAIKFTASETKRVVNVSLGASLLAPSTSHGTIKYFPSRKVQNAQDTEAAENDRAVFVNFRVQDTGLGLSDDEQNLLFKRFSQASPRTHVQYGGSGLGLFISRELTELHGGQIGLASKHREGSVFAFYIKARRVERFAPALPCMDTELSRDSDPAQLPAPHSQIDLHSCCILLVEDNLINQKVLGKQLAREAHEVHLANHGVEALDFIQTTKHWKANEGQGHELSLILLDVEMPVMDGLTCIRKIRDLEREGLIRSHIPVIAVTANVRLEQVIIAKEAGMDDLISKPFRIVDLVALMQQILQGPNGERGKILPKRDAEQMQGSDCHEV